MPLTPDAITSAVQHLRSGNVETLQDLPTADRARLLGLCMIDCPQDFAELCDGISTAVLVDAFKAMSEGNIEQFGLVMTVAMANTPAASDWLALVELKARDRMIPYSGEREEDIAAELADDKYTREQEL